MSNNLMPDRWSLNTARKIDQRQHGSQVPKVAAAAASAFALAAAAPAVQAAQEMALTAEVGRVARVGWCWGCVETCILAY